MRLSLWRSQGRAGVEDMLKSLLSQHGLSSPVGLAGVAPSAAPLAASSAVTPTPGKLSAFTAATTTAAPAVPAAPFCNYKNDQHTREEEKKAKAEAPFFFVNDVMLRNPQATFQDIIDEWETVSTGEHRERLLANMSLREIQLLNLKANDHVETFKTAKIKPTHVVNKFPPIFSGGLLHTGDADVLPQQLEEEKEVAALSTQPKLDTNGAAPASTSGAQPEEDTSGSTQQDVTGLYTANSLLGKRRESSFRQYSVAHFAAELGDVKLLQLVAEQLVDGIPFLPPASDEAKVRESETPRVTFSWLARHGYDFNGCALSHLAAAEGNTEVLQYLVERFGAEIILNRQQRKRPSAQPVSTLWGADAHMEGLNAVGTAMLHGQLGVLSWLYDHYPSVISLMPPAELQRVLTAAALREDNPNTFEFLLTKGVVRAGDASCDVGEAVVRNGLGEALVAASEAGHLHILQWFMRTFGADVLMVAGNQGATPLHHCARGARTDVLRTLLLGEGGFTLASVVDVDVPDRRGRTPAMWCVMSSTGKKKHMIATLEVLKEAGSQWTSFRDFSGNSLLDVAQNTYSPYSKLSRYLKKHVRAASF